MSPGVCLQGVCLGGGLPPGGQGLHPGGGLGRPPWILRDTVKEQAVHILLECILVLTVASNLCLRRNNITDLHMSIGGIK